MEWSKPKDEHIVYEALSAIADGRFELLSETRAKCTSTSQGKFYEIVFDPSQSAIMSNDNMAYYVGEISYPMVAMMLVKGVIRYDNQILKSLQNIKWKEINQKNKNNYMKSVSEVLADIRLNEGNTMLIESEVKRIYTEVCQLKLQQLGEKVAPPKAY